MLPSEKAERWVRRVGYAALILIVLYIIFWVVGFISRIMHRALKQRNLPDDSGVPADVR